MDARKYWSRSEDKFPQLVPLKNLGADNGSTGVRMHIVEVQLGA